MHINSEWFERHQDCQDDAANLMRSMANIIRHGTGKKCIIASKINPVHDEDYDPSNDSDPWEPTIVMKLYLCDAKLFLEEGIIDGSITAIIRAAPQVNIASTPILIPQ